jgi:DNA replication terminus site-binding protein
MENSTIIRQVKLLSLLTESLNDLLLRQPTQSVYLGVPGLQQHLVHQLPDIFKAEEKKPLIDIPVLSSFQSTEALAMAGLHFSNFMSNQDSTISTRFTKRLPGVIHVTYEQERVRTLVNDINNLKDSIKQCVVKVPDKKRFDFVHSAIPGLMTLQVYRHILYKDISNTQLRTVSLTWARRPTTDKLTKEEAIALVSSAVERSDTTLCNSLLIEDDLLKAVKSAKTNTFKHRRYSRPLPIAQLQYNDKEHPEQSNCYLPLLLIGNPLASYKLKPLKDFILKPLNKRKKVTKEVLLSDSMNLFATYPHTE